MGLFYDGDVGCARLADPGYTYLLAVGDQTAGPLVSPNAGDGYEFAISATVEPDADGDGFGDTTQDRCSTQAATQGGCQDLVAPQTTITSAKAARIKAAGPGRKAGKKAEVTVAFAADEAATSTCSVDGAPARACSSPLTVKLRKGQHVVTVRATDAAGNVEATPARVAVQVRKATKRKQAR